MLTYSIVAIILWWIRNSYISTTNIKKKQRDIIYIVCIFIFLATFRFIIPGTDIDGYVGSYIKISDYSLLDSWDYKPIGRGYYLLTKLFSLTKLSYFGWLAFVQLLFVTAYIVLVRKYSDDLPLCLILYFTIGLFTFSITGLRQTVSMAFTWFALIYLMKKKWVISALLGIVAYYCHSSALIILFILPIYFVQNIKSIYYLIIIQVLLIGLFYNSILIELTSQLNEEHYLEYFNREEGYSATTLIFYIVLFIVPLLLNRSNPRILSENNYRLILGGALLAVLTQTFSLTIASAFRLSLYFLPFLCVFLVNAVKNNKQYTLFTFLALSFWLIYTSRAYPYRFMW